MLGVCDQTRPKPVSASRPTGGGGSKASRREMYADAGIEPALDDLLNDPLTMAVMQRDGVTFASLRTIIQSAQAGLRSRVNAY